MLERLAEALMLTEPEREHLFLIGLGRLPPARYHPADVTPRLKRVLDALDPTPALIRTAMWDVLAWNGGATVLMGDYGAMPAGERNLLRSLFLGRRERESHGDWEGMARLVVAAFRLDAARAGAGPAVQPLVDELRRESPEFDALWRDPQLGAPLKGLKRIHHPALGAIEVETSAFAVDGRPDLILVVFDPLEPADLERIAALIGT